MSLYNLETEQFVLGTILMQGQEALGPLLSTGLEAKHFYDSRNQVTYRAMWSLIKNNIPIDLKTVKESLDRSGQLDNVGIVYLANLGVGVPLNIDMSHYAREILTLAKTRILINKAHNLNDAAKSDNGSLPDALEDLATAIDDFRMPAGQPAEHDFRIISEDRYLLTIPEYAIKLEVDRVRREHNALIGEVSITCAMPGVPTFAGTLSIDDLNFSSARAKADRAKLLTARTKVKNLDWDGILEEFCQRVLAAERIGQPAVDLRTLDRPGTDDSIFVAGISLPRRHPAILFGDGSCAKSYLGLYLLGLLSQQGLRVGFFDWELAGEDHRDRLERLFGSDMPSIYYARCERALIHESDRLCRIVRDEQLDYVVHDSIAFACDGPPESAEIAGRYFRAVRQIGIGSLHIAHITKSEGGDQKPFGSVFWHNGARSTYYVQLSDSSTDGKAISIGIFNRKSNLSGLRQPTGFTINFSEDRTFFTRSNPVDTPELAEKLTIRQRLKFALRNGAKDFNEVAEELGEKVESVRKSAVRHKADFKIFNNGKVAILQRDMDTGHFVRRTGLLPVSED